MKGVKTLKYKSPNIANYFFSVLLGAVHVRKFIETIEFFNYGSEKYHRKISFKFVKSALFLTFVNTCICNL